MGAGAAAGGVVAAAIVRDLFGGRRLVVMLSRLALVTGVAPVLAPLAGSALLLVVPWRGIFVVLAAYGLVMLVSAIFLVPETLPRERQIGRASCGERGCQYEEISGGAVPLKTNKINNITRPVRILESNRQK